MAPSCSRTYLLHGLKVAVTVFFIFSLLFSPFKSAGLVGRRLSTLSEKNEMSAGSKTVLGSKPPACANKCLNCRPCMATLVIPSHGGTKFSPSSRGEDDSYYLLSWKCRCGNKLFQP